MAKYAGKVGYVTEEETSPGIWSAIETVRELSGDILRTASTFQGGEVAHKDRTLQNRISLVADAYALMNFYEIRWIEYAGAKWEVTLIDVVRPRIILTLGGIWHANKNQPTQQTT